MSRFQKGDKVRVSNGLPMPPKHHTQKVRKWRWENFDGVIYGANRNGSYDVEPVQERAIRGVSIVHGYIPAHMVTARD